MMPYFDSYRTIPFHPSFTWLPTAREAADRINSFHEDYPRRVPITQQMLELLFKIFGSRLPTSIVPQEVHTLALSAIHWFIFNDTPHAGKLRESNVIIHSDNGLILHRPPDWQIVPKLVAELQDRYLGKIRTIQDLVDWYTEFETIHPFQDGNGRVGGVIVGCFAHAQHPEKGWLAPNQ